MSEHLTMTDTTLDKRERAIAAAIWQALDSVKDPCHLLSGHDLSIVDLGLVNRVGAGARRAGRDKWPRLDVSLGNKICRNYRLSH